jgi:thioesterase domain-containing protein
VNILIGGWSLGGLLALEVAKILTGDRGVRIIGALMMDSIYPVNPPSMVRLGALDDMAAGEKSKNELLTLQAMKEALRVIQKWTPPVWARTEVRPRFSLLRALDAMPATGIDGVHPADIHRSDPTLGWDAYDTSLFTDVEGVPGTHFEMFSFQHVEGLSKAVKRCLDRLDLLYRLSHSRGN